MSSNKKIKSLLEDISKSIKSLDISFNTKFDNLSREISDIGEGIREGSKQDPGGNEGTDLAGILSQAWVALGATSALNSISRATNSLIDSTNQMQRLGVDTYKGVEDYREYVVSTAKELNRDTGSKYNLQDMYKDIATLTESTNIARMDTLKEITRPSMLAYKAMNVSLESIASFSSKLYEYAGIDSLKLEKLLGHTKTVSQGMNVSEQKIQDIQNEMSDLIMARMYKTGQEENIDDAMKDIANATTVLSDSLGEDNASYFMDLITKAVTDPTSVSGQLASLGVSYDEVGDALESQDVTSLAVKMLNNASSLYENMGKNFEGTSADAYGGLDLKFLQSSFIATESGKINETLDKFAENLENPVTLEESVGDQHINLQDKIINELSTHTELLTDIRESLGFGFSEVISVIITVAALMKLFGSGKGGGASDLLDDVGDSLLNKQGGSPLKSLGASASKGLGKLGGGLAKSGATASVGSGLAVAGGALAGVAMAAKGGYDVYQDFKNDEVDAGTAMSGVGAAGGAVGAGALLALGASNPVGWVALAVGGIALLGSHIHKLATTYGEAEAIGEEFKNAKSEMLKETRDQKDTLLEISNGLSKNEDLEAMRTELINSGILSEHDIEEARTANKEGLEELTKAYLNATDNFSEEYKLSMDKYEKENKAYAKELKGNIVDQLQAWNDGKRTEENLDSVDSVLYSLFSDLEAQVSEKGIDSLDKDTKKIYEDMVNAYEDGSLSWKEANNIIDEGFWNTTFQNANFGLDSLITATDKLSVVNSEAANNIKNTKATYYGSTSDITHVMELANKALTATNVESAKEYLDQLKSEGYTSSKFTEIGDAAKHWGLNGYAVGTNYVPNDQIALIHKGEAVVPEEYNPSANITELEMLRNQSKTSSVESSENLDRMSESLGLLVTKLDTLLNEFTTYKDDVEKIHKDDKLESRAKANQISMSTRFSSNGGSSNTIPFLPAPLLKF